MNIDLGFVFTASLQNLISSLLLFSLKLVVALLIFVLGWLFSLALAKIIKIILEKTGFNRFFHKYKTLNRVLARIQPELKLGDIFGEVCKWIVVLLTLAIAVDVLGWLGFEKLLMDLINYLPNIIVAILISIVALMIGDGAEKLVASLVAEINKKYSSFLGKITKATIWLFSFFAILVHLGIARELILILFMGIISFFVLAGGLAFGLGLKDIVAKKLNDYLNKEKKTRN